MSIYIPGMEMPKHGSYLFTVRYDAAGNLCVYPLVYMPGFDDRDMKPETPLFPIIPIPDHGRLIDADALIDEAYQPGAYGYMDAFQIANAPTIIPASKEEADV